MSSSFSSINQVLAVAVFEDGEAASKAGYDYNTGEFTGLRIVKAVVVQRGTEEGRSTVDFILEDSNGKKYVTLITGRLLKMLPL